MVELLTSLALARFGPIEPTTLTLGGCAMCYATVAGYQQGIQWLHYILIKNSIENFPIEDINVWIEHGLLFKNTINQFYRIKKESKL